MRTLTIFLLVGSNLTAISASSCKSNTKQSECVSQHTPRIFCSLVLCDGVPPSVVLAKVSSKIPPVWSEVLGSSALLILSCSDGQLQSHWGYSLYVDGLQNSSYSFRASVKVLLQVVLDRSVEKECMG